MMPSRTFTEPNAPMKIAKMVVVLGVLGGLAACDDDDPFFHHCPLSSSILEVCQEVTSDTELTCVVREHPQCEEFVCASWEGSDSFCSRECGGDGDCPPESTCQSYIDFRLCVPNELPPPLVTN